MKVVAIGSILDLGHSESLLGLLYHRKVSCITIQGLLATKVTSESASSNLRRRVGSGASQVPLLKEVGYLETKIQSFGDCNVIQLNAGTIVLVL